MDDLTGGGYLTSLENDGFEPFATLVNKRLVVPSQKTDYVAVNRDYFVSLLEANVARIQVDEEWYLAQAPDVKDAIERGEFRNAADHYARAGYYENRMPHPIDVDEAWYIDSYPDVAAAVSDGQFTSGHQHFVEAGYREGRFPYSGFRLQGAGRRRL